MMHIKYIILPVLIGLIIFSCKDEEFNPVVHLGSAPVITAPTAGASFVLLSTEAESLLPAFTWTAADFGFPAGTTYIVQMDLAGNNFATPTVLGNVNSLELATLKQETINSILLAKGLEAEVPANFELRVVASISDEVDQLVSEPVAISFTPYPGILIFDQLQVPGSYQGWNPADTTTIIYSEKNDGKYEGYVFFDEENAKFKYTQGPSWDVNWGDTGADGTLDPNGTDIQAGTLGIYRLRADLNALTHSYEPANWGLIGSATPDGWNSDQDMTYDPITHKISITLDLNAGEIKFRANDDWALNYGDDGNNKSLELNGANIPIAEAGNYTIDLLIVRQPKFKYAITKN